MRLHIRERLFIQKIAKYFPGLLHIIIGCIKFVMIIGFINIPYNTCEFVLISL